ncbi:aminotransferase class III-fold pyridoxal phosphate-dependent enzyme [Rhodococcus opacus]|uniref:aspartate aminotransferase family protein n=1 Tax=Rhodococcus opacus TaxID=37919 RepID=UPI001FF33DC4|nr:aminotransferase class III-fold pyridoxal phosphate-dependent enzyme [Rhodococcus opacus]UOT03272.1 aminotransferase class III-fold pyridoxal phosphate-dependent enzyme [Rhodococcus opacus]
MTTVLGSSSAGTAGSAASGDLLRRRALTLGTHSPLFYDSPLAVRSASGVWLTSMDGVTYLDGYNNVPHVGHCHPYVVEAVHQQAKELNIHTRYLNDRVLDYAEQLLATFDQPLARLFLTNSGSEANELALRIARQHTGSTGVLVTDFSYHGNTTSLAELTTALPVREPLGAHVRALTVPDLDHENDAEEAVLARSLAQVDAAIASLQEEGHGLSALLFDPLFSTEGLPRLPRGYVTAVVERVRAAGGLVVADEVQSGFGRVGTCMWGHQIFEMVPDFVTLGKPMGNGHPMGGVITTAELLDEFGSNNLYFNTFAGNPVSAAAGLAVLKVMKAEQLADNAQSTGQLLRDNLAELADRHDFLGAAKGAGLFTGLEFVDAATGAPAPALAKQVVEAMLGRQVLISRIGRSDNMLKIRPPLPFTGKHVDILTDRLADCLAQL